MNRTGLALALGAYLIWGLFPLYWKQLESIPSGEILAHRIVWASLFMLFLTIVRKQWRSLLNLIASPRHLFVASLATILVAINWWLYIYAVNNGHIVETSMGYFINPLVSILLGVIIFQEHLRRGQVLAVLLAAAGVVYLIIEHGSVPYIALTLACSFGLYGAVKKKAQYPVINGMALETCLLLLPAIGYLGYIQSLNHNYFDYSINFQLLLTMGGLVTLLPLLLFAAATRRISLTLIGICQYLAPSLQLMIGILVFGEKMDPARWTAFGFIWLALLVYTLEGLIRSRSKSLIVPGT